MTRKTQGGEPADPVTADAAPSKTEKPARKSRAKAKTDEPKKKRQRGRSAKEDKAALRLAERKKEALEFRMQGYTYRQIADEMKISVATAHSYVKDTIAEIPMEAAEDVRQMELARLDLMQTKMMEFFLESPDAGLVDTLIKIQNQRARYLRLYRDEDEGGSFMDQITTKLAAMVAADKPVLRPDEAIPANPVL